MVEYSENNAIVEEALKLENQVQGIVSKITSVLDEKISYILSNQRELTDNELQVISLELPLIIYNIYTQLETLGGKSDCLKIIAEHLYNKAYINQDVGTVEKRKCEAKNSCLETEMRQVMFNRAYKIIQGKLQSAYEVVNSVKRIISTREKEMQTISKGSTFNSIGEKI